MCKCLLQLCSNLHKCQKTIWKEVKTLHPRSNSKTAFLLQRPPRTTWMTNYASSRSEIWWAWQTTVTSLRRSVKLGAPMSWAVTLTQTWMRTDCRKCQVPPRSFYSHNLSQPFSLAEEVLGNVITLWCLYEIASKVTCLLLALTKTWSTCECSQEDKWLFYCHFYFILWLFLSFCWRYLIRLLGYNDQLTGSWDDFY